MQAQLEIHYLPNLTYLSKFAQHDKILIEIHENYHKGSYRNRAVIEGSNGTQRLSIPLKRGKNEQQKITKVEIAYHDNWQNNHWRAIMSAYGKSPFFDHYATYFEPLYKKKYKYLFDFNWQILKTMLSLLQINTEVVFSERYETDLSKEIVDLRNTISPKTMKTNTEFQEKHYPQVFESKFGFQPNLSGLDALFCIGPETMLML